MTKIVIRDEQERALVFIDLYSGSQGIVLYTGYATTFEVIDRDGKEIAGGRIGPGKGEFNIPNTYLQRGNMFMLGEVMFDGQRLDKPIAPKKPKYLEDIAAADPNFLIW